MKKQIIFYLFISLTSIYSQEQTKIFKLHGQIGSGINKMPVNGLYSSIDVSSKIGYGFSFSLLVGYQKYSHVQFLTGVEFKYNKIQTVLGNIKTGLSLSKSLDPIEITEAYTVSSLSIPIYINFKLHQGHNIGIGISYDYPITVIKNKTIKNNLDPAVEKLNSNFIPGNHSFLIYYKYNFSNRYALSPELEINSAKADLPIPHYSLEPLISFKIKFELKV